MGEQNRRAVELEHPPGEAAPAAAPAGHATPRDRDAERALSPEAEERQTRRQAPDGAWPGEGAEDDSIG